MNGAQDMGGMHGFGRVVIEEDEPVFHHDWERRIFGIQISTRGRGINNLDEVRHGLEKVDPGAFLAACYYEKWILMLEALLVEKGVLTREELDSRRRALEADTDSSLPSFEDDEFVNWISGVIREGGPASIDVDPPPAFAVGDNVVTKNEHPKGHTRRTRYTAGRPGVIERVYDAFPLPDLNAHGVVRAEYVYAVRFEGRELWGESAEPAASLTTDCWESYLAPA